uniref:NADP-dependent oxidoreductase domain-containing protein n=1 Tax=Varanus komodoensis TaxID=61221 RepID=A0A8D2LMJ1_VARKO
MAGGAVVILKCSFWKHSIDLLPRRAQKSSCRTVWLNTGAPMPLLGLGTFRLQGEEAVQLSLDAALENGYRLLDTAAVYHNEAAIGHALGKLLPRHGLTRSDVFLTSKLSPRDHGEELAEEACLRSLKELGCDYLDLYLIHWPAFEASLRASPPTPFLLDSRFQPFGLEGERRGLQGDKSCPPLCILPHSLPPH